MLCINTNLVDFEFRFVLGMVGDILWMLVGEGGSSGRVTHEGHRV